MVVLKLGSHAVERRSPAREMRQADAFEDSQTNWRKSFKSFLRKGSAKISAGPKKRSPSRGSLSSQLSAGLGDSGDSDLDRELTLSETEFTQVLQNSKHLRRQKECTKPGVPSQSFPSHSEDPQHS